MVCRQCGQELPDWARYCLMCAAPQRESAVSESFVPGASLFVNNGSYNEWKKQFKRKVPDNIVPIDPANEKKPPEKKAETPKKKPAERVGLGEMDFGTKDGEPIRWLVIKTIGEAALIISKDCICDMPFHERGGHISWHDCTLRMWLNTKFLSKCLTPAEKDRIIPCTLDNYSGKTTDKAFLLSADEVNTLFADNKKRANGSWWWLRTPGINDSHAAGVNYNGEVFTGGSLVYIEAGVRPAMWIKTAGINV